MLRLNFSPNLMALTCARKVDIVWNDVYSQYAYILQDERISNWMNDAFSSVGTWFSGMASASAEGMVSVGSGVAISAMVIGFSLVVAFWVLMELPALGAEIKRVFGPRFREDLDIIYLTGTRVMGVATLDSKAEYGNSNPGQQRQQRRGTEQHAVGDNVAEAAKDCQRADGNQYPLNYAQEALAGCIDVACGSIAGRTRLHCQ